MSSGLLDGQIMTALHNVRLALQADQADVAVVGLDGSTLNLDLIIGPDTCTDCMMPRPVLEDIMLRHVRASMPLVQHVSLNDPREDSGAA